MCFPSVSRNGSSNYCKLRWWVWGFLFWLTTLWVVYFLDLYRKPDDLFHLLPRTSSQSGIKYFGNRNRQHILAYLSHPIPPSVVGLFQNLSYPLSLNSQSHDLMTALSTSDSWTSRTEFILAWKTLLQEEERIQWLEKQVWLINEQTGIEPSTLCDQLILPRDVLPWLK